MHKIEIHENGEIIEWLWATKLEMIPEPVWTSCYLIDGLLIDSGSFAGLDEFEEFLDSDYGKTITKCVLTHSHEDHASGAVILNKRSIPVYGSESTVEILKQGFTFPVYRQLLWGEKTPKSKVLPIKSPISTASGKFMFHILEMPGHNDDLIAYIEKNKQWVFVSDALKPRYSMVFDEPNGYREDIRIIFNSIQNLYDFTENMDDLKIFIPGFGVYYGRNFIKEIIDNIIEIHKKAHEYNDLNYKIKKIVRKLFKGETVAAGFTQNHMSRANLVKQLIEWPLK